MENNPVLLKSSMFGGFKKKDVLSYIFELNEATQEEKQKLAEQLEELVQSRDSLAANAMEMEQKVASLQASLDNAQASLDDALARLGEETSAHARSRELIGDLSAETAKHESTISQQNAELARQTEINAQASEKNRIYEEKRHQVELAAAQIADLLGQAQEDAAKTVERAKHEAEEILERAKQEAEHTVQSAKDSLEAHVDKANESVDGAYQKFSVFKAGIENLHRAISDTTQTINEQMHAFKASIGDIEKLVPEKLSTDDLPSLQYRQEPAPEVPEIPDVSDVYASALGAVNTESPMTTEAAPELSSVATSTATAVAAPSMEEEVESMTQSILRSYGVRKDDSGFFRLASD